MKKRTVELLAPARDLSCGKAAINHGADAVYIGGPRFSARFDAANSIEDIEALVHYAHQFHARVYVALNTLLSDTELEEAVVTVHRLYDVGVDALIIQDVGLLECDLPPIELHSSTQMNNQTPEKVRFLQQVGFSQVVLARELSLQQIGTIHHAAPQIRLEFFVHGALCVSYSGQCYISEVVAGRSANRGSCAQFCRHGYDLTDLQGNQIAQGKYLLSLHDLDLSGQLEALLDAGVSAFKIEGRLKDERYVKNITAYYRQKLDRILEDRTEFSAASSGRCTFSFSPDPAKVFHRGGCEYFLTRHKNKVAEIRTPKSTGKEIGQVQAVTSEWLLVNTGETLHNGDGLCFFTADNQLIGFRVNRVEGRKLFCRDHKALRQLHPGDVVYRNLDTGFARELEKSERCRKIALELELSETTEGLQLRCIDEDGLVSVTEVSVEKEQARKAGMLEQVARRQLNKCGETIFTPIQISVHVSDELFVPAAQINELRREALEQHTKVRFAAWKRPEAVIGDPETPWPNKNLTYQDNITNTKAVEFYRRHGVENARSIAVSEVENPLLMITKYCLRYQLDICSRRTGNGKEQGQPLILSDKTGQYILEFDCEQCEMHVKRVPLSDQGAL